MPALRSAQPSRRPKPISDTAMMVGVLSHVPGGVGVFETVVIGTLPADVPVGDAAAALLLFRLIVVALRVFRGEQDLLVASHEVEDQIDEAAQRLEEGK